MNTFPHLQTLLERLMEESGPVAVSEIAGVAMSFVEQRDALEQYRRKNAPASVIKEAEQLLNDQRQALVRLMNQYGVTQEQDEIALIQGAIAQIAQNLVDKILSNKQHLAVLEEVIKYAVETWQSVPASIHEMINKVQSDCHLKKEWFDRLILEFPPAQQDAFRAEIWSIAEEERARKKIVDETTAELLLKYFWHFGPSA